MRSLPIRVQRLVNSKAYAALPLCAVLGAGLHSWFSHRFVQLCSYRLTSRPDEHVLDYPDSFAYTTFLDASVVSREAAGSLGPLVDFLRARFDEGRCSIVMLDSRRLTGAGPRIREFLLSGFAGNGDLLATGFDGDGRFAAMTFRPDEVNDAFTSGLAAMRGEGQLHLIRSVIQTLRPPDTDETLSLDRIYAEMCRYLACTPPTGFTVTDGWWWYDRAVDIAATAPVRFGISTHDGVREHLELAADGTVPVDYPMLHLYYEHKRLLMHRQSLLAFGRNLDQPERAVAGYGRFVDEVNRFRLGLLMGVTEGRRPTRDELARFAGFEEREGNLLEQFLTLAEHAAV